MPTVTGVKDSSIDLLRFNDEDSIEPPWVNQNYGTGVYTLKRQDNVNSHNGFIQALSTGGNYNFYTTLTLPTAIDVTTSGVYSIEFYIASDSTSRVSWGNQIHFIFGDTAGPFWCNNQFNFTYSLVTQDGTSYLYIRYITTNKTVRTNKIDLGVTSFSANTFYQFKIDIYGSNHASTPSQIKIYQWNTGTSSYDLKGSYDGSTYWFTDNLKYISIGTAWTWNNKKLFISGFSISGPNIKWDRALQLQNDIWRADILPCSEGDNVLDYKFLGIPNRRVKKIGGYET